MSEHDVVEKFKIINHPYNKYLNNQNGLKAKCDIPIHTLLGIYYGARLSRNEFSQMFKVKNEEYYGHKIYHADGEHDTMWLRLDKITYDQYQHQDFSTHKKYLGIAAGNDVETNNKPLLTKNEFDVLKEELIKKFKQDACTIDPTLMSMDKQRPLIMYCNDPRKNMFEPGMTDEDREYRNVKFVTIYVNCVGYYGVMSTKNIKKDEEIMLYYGSSYHNLMREMHRETYEQMNK